MKPIAKVTKRPRPPDTPEVANRRLRLRQWIATFDSKAEVERQFGIDAAHLWQLENKGSFGEKAASNICRKAGLPKGYFDQPATANLSPGQADLLDAAKLAPALSDDMARSIAQLIRSSQKSS